MLWSDDSDEVGWAAGPTTNPTVRVVAGFEPLGVDPDLCVSNATRFGTDRFRDGLADVVSATVAEAPAPHRARRRAAPRRPPRLLVRA